MREPFVFAGAVLAGGRARRFGSDKCEHRYRGATLLARALRSLEGAEERFVVGGARRKLGDATWLPDEHPGAGPLAGLQVALTATKRPWLALLGCDMPFVPAVLWTLLGTYRDGVQMVVPQGPTGLEPLAALYRRDLASEVEEALERGHLAIGALADATSSHVVAWSDLRELLPENTFLNANRPEELP